MIRTRPKHFFTYTLLSVFALAGAWGCRKDAATFRPYPPTLEDIQQLLAQVPAATSQTVFPLSSVASDIELSTPGGVRVFLTDTEQLFADADGNPIPCSTCQILTVEVTEALDKGDIIAQNVPTTTIEGKLLESGGMVRITVTCDGKPLQLLPDRKLKIQIPADKPVDDMLVFSGIFENDNFLGWQNTDLQTFQAEWLVTNTNEVQEGYELFSPHLNWINCDRFLTEPTSPFCIDLPPDFNPENTKAYIVFKNILSVAVLGNDVAHQKFCFPNAPTGHQVRLVTLSKTADGQYWLGNYETEIGTDATVQVTPQQVSEQEMLDFLKSL